MTQRMFHVTAVWDDEAQVYYCQSDIIGLHVEAPTIDAFEAVMLEVAPGLIADNHMSVEERASSARADLIPTILWQRPAGKAA